MMIPREYWCIFTIDTIPLERVHDHAGSSVNFKYNEKLKYVTASSDNYNCPRCYQECSGKKHVKQTGEFYKIKTTSGWYYLKVNDIYMDNFVDELPDSCVVYKLDDTYDLHIHMDKLCKYIGQHCPMLDYNNDNHIVDNTTGIVVFYWKTAGKYINLSYMGYSGGLESIRLHNIDEFEDWLNQYIYDLSKMPDFKHLSKQLDLACYMYEDEK